MSDYNCMNDGLLDLVERNSNILYSLIEYLAEQGNINKDAFVDYCNQISGSKFFKEIRRNEADTRSVNDNLHPGGIKSTITLCEMAGVDSSKLVLDAGTGHGGAARVIAENYGCKVIAIDSDYVRLVNAIFRTKAVNLDYLISFKQDNAYQTSFKDSYFDVIIRQHSVYGGDEKVFISECNRILKNNGVIAFQGILKTVSFVKEKNNLEDFTLKEYEDLLKNSGFCIEEIETKNSKLELAESYRKLNDLKREELVRKGLLAGFMLVARKI